jgi:hypothetical protein
MVRDRGQRRMRGIGKGRKHTHRRPGAHLDSMAGQCLRGRPEAAQGWLHRTLTGSTTSRHFHRRVLKQRKHQRLRSKHRRGGSAKHQTGDDWRRQIPRGRTTRSPRGGGARRFHPVEMVEGARAHVSPKVATTEVTGAGRRGKAAAAANQSRQWDRGGEKGWGRSGSV